MLFTVECGTTYVQVTRDDIEEVVSGRDYWIECPECGLLHIGEPISEERKLPEVGRTGTPQERLEYVQARLESMTGSILGIEDELEKLGQITPEWSEDFDDLASRLDAIVGYIYSVKGRMDD